MKAPPVNVLILFLALRERINDSDSTYGEREEISLSKSLGYVCITTNRDYSDGESRTDRRAEEKKKTWQSGKKNETKCWPVHSQECTK